MELFQLRYFLAVAETGNFTKAAQRSFISQPSLSQQILNLEEEFGQQLFHRLGRKAVLTEAGKTLMEGTRRILGEVDQTLQDLKDNTEQGPKVIVGAIPTVAPFFFPAILAYCRASDIQLNINTREDFRRPLAEAVLDGELDWALISLPFNEPRLHIEKLYSEPLWVAMSSTHRLAKAEQLTFESLRNEQFILLGEASTLTLIGCTLGVVMGALGAWGIRAVSPIEATIPLGSIIAAILSAIATGVIFGMYPALKASRLDPIEALRYE